MIAIQNISRHDHKPYHAWVARIRRRGRVVERYFADRAHGGRTKALKAALAFRDQTLERQPLQNAKHGRTPFCRPTSPSSTLSATISLMPDRSTSSNPHDLFSNVAVRGVHRNADLFYRLRRRAFTDRDLPVAR